MTWVVVLAVVAGAIVWARESLPARGRAKALQRAALESEAVGHYYSEALAMARILDRIVGDEMMAVTIPAELRREIRELVESFFDEGGHRARRR